MSGVVCNSNSVPRAQKLLLASKLSEAKLENGKLRLISIQEEITLKAMATTVPEYEERVKSPDPERKILLLTNEERLQRSCWTSSHLSEERNTLIIPVPMEFIGSPGQMEFAILGWGKMEVSGLWQYDK